MMTDRSELEVKLPIRGMLVGFLVIFALLVLVTAATHIRGMKGREQVVLVLMMIFGAYAVSFTAAMMNPFTLCVAQRVAGLPLFSGLLFHSWSGSSCWA